MTIGARRGVTAFVITAATVLSAASFGALGLAACTSPEDEAAGACTGPRCSSTTADGAAAADGGAGSTADGQVPTASSSNVDASYTNVCIGFDAAAAPRATLSGSLIAAGVAQRRAFSNDAVNWQDDSYVVPDVDASTPIFNLLSIAVGPSMMVAAADRGIMTSPDGKSWTVQTLPEVRQYVPYFSGFRAAAYGKGVYVVAASADYNDQAFFHSTDGVTWPQPSVVADECCHPINALAFGGDKFVGVGTGLRTIVSDDGVSWRNNQPAYSGAHFTSVTFGNGVWVAVGLPSIIAWSPDGVAWTFVSTPPSDNPDAAPAPLSVGNFRSVVFDGAKFVTCVSFACYSSSDGKSWTQGPGAQFDPRPDLYLRFQEGMFVGIAAPATILTSADGLAWQPVFCGQPPELRTLAFKPN